MVLPATERTTQVPPACVAGMREKANPAVHAVNDAALKFGDGTATPSPAPSDIAGQAAWRDRPGANPRETRKTSRWRWQKSQTFGYNSYCFRHTLVLPHRCKCFERQGEVFCAPRARICRSRPHKRSTSYRSPRPFSLPSQRRPAAPQIPKSLLGKKEASSSFQVAGNLAEQRRGNLAERQVADPGKLTYSSRAGHDGDDRRALPAESRHED